MVNPFLSYTNATRYGGEISRFPFAYLSSDVIVPLTIRMKWLSIIIVHCDVVTDDGVCVCVCVCVCDVVML